MEKFIERFGKILNSFKANGKTEIDICNDLNISHKTFQNWKKGNFRRVATTLTQISKYFAVSVDYLVGLKDDYK